MITSRRLGLLGGTFDPIHYGHLDAAEAAKAALSLDEVLLIPACDPQHRASDPCATAFHRFALASLAVDGRSGYRVSDMELVRQGPSYTSDTLRALHNEGWNASQLFFILGADAFSEIATWHEFPAVLDAAHFVVIARPGTTIEAAIARTPDLRVRACLASEMGPIGTTRTGTRIVLVEARTRNVSSTMVRQRLAARNPIVDLLPPAVARHIFAHHLYGAVGDLHG
ncbi:MAG: nicotinate-nucleotide adenylyltransferase [Vicinamibacterales bacterium]